MPPLPELAGPEGLAVFCRAIVEATHDQVCAFKPNLAFFLAHGSGGIRALEETIAAIPDGIPVVLDAKVGDIGSTQRMYGAAAFAHLGVDAVTVSPYVGEDAVVPLLAGYPGRGVFVLARTSNADALRFQDHPGQPPYLFQAVVEAALGWAGQHPESTVGLVVGATHAREIEAVRVQAPALPFLIPGIGAQGGTLDEAVRFGATVDGIGPLINASRSVIYAGSGRDYAAAARSAVVELRTAINQLR
jgi:orotidine-5'-phosphate decarboxylase